LDGDEERGVNRSSPGRDAGDALNAPTLLPPGPKPAKTQPSSSAAHQSRVFREQNFAAKPTAHSINAYTASSDSIDLLVGFATGDILLYDPITKVVKRRLNEVGVSNKSRVMALKWIPDTRARFVAAFANGLLLVYDALLPPAAQPANAAKKKKSTSSIASFFGFGDDSTDDEEEAEESLSPLHRDQDVVGAGFDGTFPRITHQMKRNPVARWKVSASAINAAEFSPNGTFLATGSGDGYARVFDFAEERLIAAFPSYYGAITCLAWSPDSKLLLLGGQDDLVILYSVDQCKPLAKAVGHRSWISSVSFDPWHSSPSNGIFRFASVGHDTRLFLWEYRAQQTQPSFFTMDGRHAELYEPKPQSNKGASSTVLSMPDPDLLPSIDPIVEHRAHHRPISDVSFTKNGLITICVGGMVKVWELVHSDPSLWNSLDRKLATRSERENSLRQPSPRK